MFRHIIGKYCIIVDDTDSRVVQSYKWKVTARKSNAYAWARIDGKTTYLHRFLLKAPPDLQVDHVNGNGLDCRRANMRLVSCQQNRFNTRKAKGRGKSFYKGVSTRVRSGLWRAYIGHNGKHIELGEFHSEYEAARAYDEKAIELFGPFAQTNHPISDYLQSIGPLPGCCVATKTEGKQVMLAWTRRRDAVEFRNILIAALRSMP